MRRSLPIGKREKNIRDQNPKNHEFIKTLFLRHLLHRTSEGQPSNYCATLLTGLPAAGQSVSKREVVKLRFGVQPSNAASVPSTPRARAVS